VANGFSNNDREHSFHRALEVPCPSHNLQGHDLSPRLVPEVNLHMAFAIVIEPPGLVSLSHPVPSPSERPTNPTLSLSSCRAKPFQGPASGPETRKPVGNEIQYDMNQAMMALEVRLSIGPIRPRTPGRLPHSGSRSAHVTAPVVSSNDPPEPAPEPAAHMRWDWRRQSPIHRVQTE
jgi:hypothetical protein